MQATDYRIVVEPLSEEDGGGYLATVPDLPGCMADGETGEEAWANAQDAIAAWIARSEEMERPVPRPQHYRQYA